MPIEEWAKLLGGGLQAAVIVGLAGAVWLQRSELMLMRDKHLADKDADKERLLKMADQNREVVLQANTITVTNTAALEAQRLRDERIIAALTRLEGRP